MLIVFASLDAVLNIVKTVLGIGGIIFVHELGHFLVGRMCGVKAEAFSIGFGPVLWKWTPGETEYRFSAVPLGGYVKFLGENPDERGERDPRSFHAATYPRKVAIMLAGVTMNVIAAFALFAIVFTAGWQAKAPVIGVLAQGGSAWEHGLREGDEFVSIDSHRILDFGDVVQETLFSDSVEVVVRRDGSVLPPMHIPTRPNDEGLRQIGVGAADDGLVTIDTSAEGAEKSVFRDGDRIVAVEGRPVGSASSAMTLAAKLERPTTWTVERDGARVDVVVPVRKTTARRIGVSLGAARLSVRADSPASSSGLRPGDTPVRVGAKATPSSVAFVQALRDPAIAGPAVVSRDGAETEIALPGDPAARAAIADSVHGRTESGQVWASLQPGDGPARAAHLPEHFHVTSVDGETLNWAAQFTAAVGAAKDGEPVVIGWTDASGAEQKTSVVPAMLDGSEPDLGPVLTGVRTSLVKEPNVFAAMGLGLDRTQRWIQRIFATLRSIATGRISGTKLAGPIMIAKGTYSQAESSWGDFLLFLGMISMNLAVLNVLPVPLLDGGQLAVCTIERIRGKPLPDRVLEGVQWAGLVLLLGLMVYVVRNDIVNLL